MNELIPNLKEAYEAVAHVLAPAKPLLDATLNFASGVLSELTAAALGTGAVAYFVYQKAKRDFRDGDFKEDGVVVSHTFYAPTGRINPVTGNQFFEQQITTLDGFDLENVFRGKYAKGIIKQIIDAAQDCTPDQSAVFLALLQHKFIGSVGKPENERTYKYIRDHWIGHFSTILNKMETVLRIDCNEENAPNLNTKYAVLAFEAGAKRKIFRTFFIDEDYVLGKKQLPDARDILIDGEYKPDDHAMLRRETLGSIIKNLQDNPWLAYMSGIRVYDGTSVKVKLETATAHAAPN